MIEREMAAQAVASALPLEIGLVGGVAELEALRARHDGPASAADPLLRGADLMDFAATLDMLKEALSVAILLVQAYRLMNPSNEERKDDAEVEKKLKKSLPAVSAELAEHIEPLVKAVVKLLKESDLD